MNARGTFETTLHREPPFDDEAGVSLGRTGVDKRFSGALEGTGRVEMLGVGTPVKGSMAYVAMEKVRGQLEGREGTFVLQHVGSMRAGAFSLVVTVVPDTGTGALRGLVGRMEIRIEAGKHFYDFEYSFEE